MTTQPSRAEDKKIEQVIGTLLRTGVLLSAAFVLFGGVMYLLRNYAGAPAFRVFDGDTPFTSLKHILVSAHFHNSQAIIQIGILILIATPVARVLFSVLAFARERDGMYVLFSFIVFVILIFSIFHGAAI